MMTIEGFISQTGQSLGCSMWFNIDQDRINRFAEVTEDYQFIHVDVERAKAETPFGGTIAHGFLTLSLLSHLNSQVFPQIQDRKMTFNYGLNKVRFLNPVRCDANIRSEVTLQSVVEKSSGRYLCQFSVTVEIEGEETPALIAEQLAMYVIDQPGG